MTLNLDLLSLSTKSDKAPANVVSDQESSQKPSEQEKVWKPEISNDAPSGFTAGKASFFRFTVNPGDILSMGLSVRCRE